MSQSEEKGKIKNDLDFLLLLLLLRALRRLGLFLSFGGGLVQATQKLGQKARAFGNGLLGFRLNLNQEKDKVKSVLR